MIQTVTGSISPQNIGNILIHEHIQCVSNDMLHTFGSKWLDEEKLFQMSTSILKALHKDYNLGLFVDGTPCDTGRNINTLKKVSEASGVPIVASSGLYHYPDCFSAYRSARELAYWFLDECQHGMEGTECLPGILKCAIDRSGMTADAAKRIAAMGYVQSQTGLPLYAHCIHTGKIVDEMLDILLENGADPHKIIIGHVCFRLDCDYLEHLLKRGCYVCFDQIFTSEKATEAASIVVQLCRKGYMQNLLFSMDHPIYNEFSTSDNTGIERSEISHINVYSFLYTVMLPTLYSAGCSKEECLIMLQKNPAHILNI